MDSSTRLYTRLGEIPSDPNDPESLADLLVCAFGAFERYYVCWKTAGGEYRQDGYDLPTSLKNWLYPTDGSTRDFSTLQVVFGRGEEYFASDKNGKLEYKEPEVKKAFAGVGEEEEKPANSLRRARTVSFLRPLSDVSVRSDGTRSDGTRSDGTRSDSTGEMAESRRSSSASSKRASRPPSLSYSRTSSTASMLEELGERPGERYASRSSQLSMVSQWEELGTGRKDAESSPHMLESASLTPSQQAESLPEGLVDVQANPQTRSPALTIGADARRLSNFAVPEGYMLVPISSAAAKSPSSCTRGCHDRPTYASSSTQTDSVPSPLRSALRIDTTASSHWASDGYSAMSRTDLSPMYNEISAENPIFMGRMMNYFSKPSYQLGDSLMSGYQNYQPLVYLYQGEFGAEAPR